MSQKKSRKEKLDLAPTPMLDSGWRIPDFQLRVSRAPWSLAGIHQIFGHYEESTADAGTGSSVETFSLNTTLRVKMEWTPKRDILLFMHAEVVTQSAPVVVNCEVVYRMTIQRPADVPDPTMFEFARTVGVRALFPYVRAAVANISSQGSLGTLHLQPANLDVVVAEPEKQD